MMAGAGILSQEALQLIGMAKRMLEDDILSLEKIAEYSGLELAEAENL